MAAPRTAPYIWVKWLAGIMSGENQCHWQAWFQAHNMLTEKQPSDFDLVGWQIDHSRLLSELTKELASEKGLLLKTEYRLRHSFGKSGTTLEGKADVVCWGPPAITVYDCKTGKERGSDQVQVMCYMWLLGKSAESTGKHIVGEVVYRSRRQPIPKLPDTFEDNLEYFIELLSQRNEPIRAPGDACRFCPITKIDCPDRVESK